MKKKMELLLKEKKNSTKRINHKKVNYDKEYYNKIYESSQWRYF